jgi:hypothetical protein
MKIALILNSGGRDGNTEDWHEWIKMHVVVECERTLNRRGVNQRPNALPQKIQC